MPGGVDATSSKIEVGSIDTHARGDVFAWHAQIPRIQQLLKTELEANRSRKLCDSRAENPKGFWSLFPEASLPSTDDSTLTGMVAGKPY